MLHLNDVTVRLGGRAILAGASLHLPAGHRYGLVGRNGAGKSTLLRLIDQDLQPDGGEVRLRRNARLGKVAQEAPGGRTTPLEAVLAADVERAALLHEAETTTDPGRIGEVHTRLAEIDAHTAPIRAERILKGLGFDPAMQARPLSSYSGGWRMRVALAAVLFAEPDLLLLDEPTNHLDIEATLWLQTYLKSYPHTLLVVSHDRDLLNEVPERIVHLEDGKTTLYTGGFDDFIRIRGEQRELLAKQAASVDAKRKHMQAFVDRFRYKASKARQAQSRLKALEKLQPIVLPSEAASVRFEFTAKDLPAPPLITINDASAGYDGRIILRDLDLRIDPDDRIALLGANGNGKSTFAKLLAGRLEPAEGEIIRAPKLRFGFFAQHQIEDLVPGQTPLEHMMAARPTERAEAMRARLGRFGLGANQALQKVAVLSGGEKARLTFALMALDDPQILILDEPTNHLDIESREALIEALADFPGAVILISHDTHLVHHAADRLWLVADGRVRPFDGDLDDYRARLTGETAPKPVPEPAAPLRAASSPAKRAELADLRRGAKDAERELERLTGLKAKLDRALADPRLYGDAERAATLARENAQLSEAIATAEASWLEAEEALQDAIG
ncbi:ABC-F family ATP-binding cassette domain-containing protein [Marinivivus vitaminiproducens]|uniref:ABC-F family ATP-binding cassette domain-containing protein n=1 Tax=Marinivivus vitaminiproducens TaxID=3035935 RepID=UPI0027AA0A89|nr:ABC-F family ATP-binding cassette domain-containing protein [Geminicoccaceae bacterium SCSIO 64248]